MKSKNANNNYTPSTFVPIDDLIITNQHIDDNYINDLHHRLQDMKKERKNVEQATEMLEARVNCLKNEENKTVKQIEITRKKTKDKLRLLEKTKEDQLRRIQAEKEKEQQLQLQRQRIIKQKEMMTTGLIMTKEAKMKRVSEDAKLFKEQLKSTNFLIKSMKHDEILNKKNNNEIIKTQALINNEKKKATLLEKKAQVKGDLENKIKDELIIKAENDYKIQQLQDVEVEIMKRIQETTQMHKMLLQEFEEVIRGGIIGGNMDDYNDEEGEIEPQGQTKRQMEEEEGEYADEEGEEEYQNEEEREEEYHNEEEVKEEYQDDIPQDNYYHYNNPKQKQIYYNNNKPNNSKRLHKIK